MINFIAKKAVRCTALFIGGMIAGSVGSKVVACPCFKKAAVQTTAAVLKAKEGIMNTVTKVQENVEDEIAEAKEVNEAKEEKAEQADAKAQPEA